MAALKVLGINDEVTTCECCGRSGLKRTVVLGGEAGEVRYGTECAARALKTNKVGVERAVRSARDEAARQENIRRNREWEAYAAWLVATYGETRSSLDRVRAYRALTAA